ncbi:Uncharacterised protein [Klebsiella oxytoca]|nr:Uncharacterised protein [Klebsiella oxytoca]
MVSIACGSKAKQVHNFTLNFRQTDKSPLPLLFHQIAFGYQLFHCVAHRNAADIVKFAELNLGGDFLSFSEFPGRDIAEDFIFKLPV